MYVSDYTSISIDGNVRNVYTLPENEIIPFKIFGINYNSSYEQFNVSSRTETGSVYTLHINEWLSDFGLGDFYEGELIFDNESCILYYGDNYVTYDYLGIISVINISFI